MIDLFNKHNDIKVMVYLNKSCQTLVKSIEID